VSASVLLIEDNAENRYLLTFLLEKNGYRVVSIVDGTQALESALSLMPTVILLDIQLPKMDGYAVARLLRRHEQLRRIPIVAVTSYAMPGDRERAIEAGCSGYIEKPINPATFLAEMERVIAAG
jgi:two-component system cell cycle response regulator DivK